MLIIINSKFCRSISSTKCAPLSTSPIGNHVTKEFCKVENLLERASITSDKLRLIDPIKLPEKGAICKAEDWMRASDKEIDSSLAVDWIKTAQKVNLNVAFLKEEA